MLLATVSSLYRTNNGISVWYSNSYLSCYFPIGKCLRGDSRSAGFRAPLIAKRGIFYLPGGLDRQALTHLTKVR